ncbi:MAG: 4Fe-4S binding protein [Acidobacteria bacterium]|nr:4Fe-4S binding protein [Acidobacteriota bacterium]
MQKNTAMSPPALDPSPARPRKRLIRRLTADRSQALRRGVQLAFFALNVWIGVQFYLFVRYYETGGHSVYASRPPGVEGWLPIASLMNLKVWVMTGEAPAMHVAGMFLLLGFLAISWLLRKSFCGWLCPVGTFSEWLWRLGKRTFGRNWSLPKGMDILLRSLKYILLGLFLYAVVSMPVEGIRSFLGGPYGMVSDVKMLNFFRYLGLGGAMVLAALMLLSVFIQNFWCRYLCPYGALMGVAALFSPLRIWREASRCIDCAKCAKACPAVLPVDKLVSIKSAECTGCLQCVAVCPAEGALQMSVPKRRAVPAWAMAAAMIAIFLGVYAYAQWAGHWHTDLPGRLYFELIPRAREFTHP